MFFTMAELQRIYVIGTGFVGRLHAHAAMKLPLAGRLELLAADIDASAREDFKKEHPSARILDDVRELLAEPAKIHDIVVVATPPYTHPDLVALALNSGRHVLCEKPLALNVADATSMLQLARATDRYFGCCSTRFLGTPTTEEVKRLLGQEALGEVYHVSFINRRQRNRAGIDDTPEATWFLDPLKSGGGVLMDMGPYDFAVLNDILQPVRVDVMSAWMTDPAAPTPRSTTRGRLEQHAGASLVYYSADGRPLPVTYERAGYTQGEPRTHAEIEGTTGAVRWDWFDLIGPGEVVLSLDISNKLDTETVRLGWGDLAYDERPLRYFYDRVHGAPSLAVVNEQAVFNLACVRAIYDCATSGTVQSVCIDSLSGHPGAEPAH
jgi:predicted dehydrogenase